ncbi:hypothetical protein BDZ89DRAFT_1141597 [Hymenopellis radicata]|nr:hypothetical protein BDZ89DRAFT_1141597 [Hymenopellis radicata]
MAPLVTINRDSTATIPHERSQQLLRELLEQHNRQILSGQGRRVRDPDVLAKSVCQYAKDHDLFQLSLPSAANPSRRVMPLCRKAYLQLGGSARTSSTPMFLKEKKTARLNTPQYPNDLWLRTLFLHRNQTSPQHRLPCERRKIIACSQRITIPRPKFPPSHEASITQAQLSSPAVTPVSHPPSKRRKYKADAVNPSTENARPPTMEAIVPNDDAHNKHARAALKEVGEEKQGKAADESPAAKRFLWERMNIFDITEGWESSSAYSGGPMREEGEGRLEYLARHGLL